MTDITARLRLAPPNFDLAGQAEAVGLLDVAIATVDSPIGELLLAKTPIGLVRVSLPGRHDAALAELADRISPRILEAPKALDAVHRQLDEYFAGNRQRFDIPIDWRLVGDWAHRILQACARIPFGEVRTYGEMAAAAGSPKAFRAAGAALGHNPVPVVVPCHRVLRAGGALGGYTGGLHIKQHLLRLEGMAA